MNSVALLALGTLFLLQVFVSKARFASERNGLLVFCAALMLVFGNALLLSMAQYKLWKADALGKFLLPPYQSFHYFVFYARGRFFDSYLLSLVFGLGFLLAARIANKKYGERFFEPIEPYLFAAALLIGGTPAWFTYLGVLFSLFFVVNAISTAYVVLKKNESAPRISLYYLWLPAGLFTILISRWLSALPLWKVLTFFS